MSRKSLVYRKYLSVCIYVRACVCMVGATVCLRIGYRAMPLRRLVGSPEDEMELDLALTFSAVAKRPDT